MRSSIEAFNLIVAEEVSSRALYEKRYQRPAWPGHSSGATIGIGYDLGQTAKETIRADWQGRVSNAMLEAMVSCSGHTGAAGQTKTKQVKSQIIIPWDLAIAVHKERVIPRWETILSSHLPYTELLHPHSFGALLSLIFNRGPSFSIGSGNDRYKEMRAIKAHMQAKRFERIPDEIRSMKRLWPTSAGLKKRRDTEAALFAKGLSLTGAQPAPDLSPQPTDMAPVIVLRPGSDDAAVKLLVEEVVKEILAEGAYGPITEAAVRAIQKQHALTVDGIVGRNTWGVLLKGA